MNTLNQLVHDAYPQALAKLIPALGNIEVAEEHLQIAVEKALNSWTSFPPSNSVAWLITTARNSYIDEYRKQKKHSSWSLELEEVADEDFAEQTLKESYKDDMLRLLFTSCHPALSLERQILLSLKHVLGLSVDEIAKAMVIKKSNVQQKLLRAKHKITANALQYYIPTQKEWPQRLNGVLKVLYLLFNQGYFATEEHNFIRLPLCAEAIKLASILYECTNQHPEVSALLALLLHQDARSPARVNKLGNMVLLPDQDRGLWQQDKIQKANQLVIQSLATTGRSVYGLQAAIAALHNNAKKHEDTDWPQIYQLYQLLLEIEPSPIIELNAAIALAQTGQQQEAIKITVSLKEALKEYPYYDIVLAGLYFDADQLKQAKEQYLHAKNKCVNHGQRKFIQHRLQECSDKLKEN